MPDTIYNNPTTGLFSGIAEGFFGHQREEEERARGLEDRTRNESLKVLTGLLDDATPDTRPVLLRQIGDLMGIKGKHRTVWDRLTGAGLDDTTRAVQEKFQSVLQSVVPQSEFEKLRRVPAPGTLQVASAAGASGFPVLQQGTRDESAGKIALRNPQAEALEKLRAQYELKSAADAERFRISEEQRQQGRLDLETERQRNRLATEEAKAYNKAYGAVYERAALLPGGIRGPGNLEQAANEIADLNDLNRDKLKATIGLTKARTAESEAAAAALNASGIPGAKPLDVAKFGEQQAARYDPIYQKYNASRTRADALKAQIADIESRVNAQAGANKYKFDAATGQFTDASGKVDPFGSTMALIGNKGLKAELAKLPALRQQLQQLTGETEGLAGQLRKAPNFYRDQGGVMVPVEAPPVGTPRTGAGASAQQPTAPTSGLQRPRAGTLPLNPGGGPAGGARIPDVGAKGVFRDSRTFKPGEIVQEGGMMFQILGLEPARRGDVPGVDKAYRYQRLK